VCGIYGGIFIVPPIKEEIDKFRRLGFSLKHRGPDDSGEFVAETVLMGFNRLSIVDVDSGHQPIINSEETVVLIGNGEIYNYKEIRSKLQKLGYTFKTNSDIECLLHSYSEYGEEFLKEIRGMFAVAILDKRLRKFVLGRDRLGEKPLYFTRSSDSFWFSSESTALLKSRIKNFSVSHLGVCRFLKYGFVTEAYPLIDGIEQVEPGTIVIVDLNDLSAVKKVFWDLEDFRTIESTEEEENYKTELKEIGNSIFQGEVPIGLALSGGMDSSLIASIATKLRKKITAIIIGYNTTKKFDESKIAESFSNSIGFEYTIRNISSQEVGIRFTELIQAMDDPIADPSAFSYFVLGEEAGKLNLKVLLSGHGPDELFWGYAWISNLYGSTERRMRMYRNSGSLGDYLKVPKFTAKTVGTFIDELQTGFGVIEAIRQYFEDLHSRNDKNYSIPVYSRAPGFRKKVHIGKKIGLDLKIGKDSLEAIDSSEIVYGQKIVREILIKTYLRVNGLSQIDRLWMASSIEGRNLLVDYKLVESALTDVKNAPRSVLVRKQRFKELISDYLPSEKINQKKQGFTPPVREWYLEIYHHNKTAISNSMLVKDGLLSPKAQKLMNKPLTLIGRPKPLWLEIITLEFWYRKNFYPES